MSVSVRIDDKMLVRYLKLMRKRGQNMRPIFTIIAGTMHNDILKNFRAQGSYGDIFTTGISKTFAKWKPLSSLTLASRKGGKAILQASGILRGSIGTVREITNTSLTFGTNLGYAALQHFGGTIKPVRAKKLAIPMPGVKGKPRDYDDLFFTKSMIFQKSEGGGQPKPLFIRKDSVKIPARPYLTLSPGGLTKIQNIVMKKLTK